MLEINQTFARIGIDRTPGSLSINSKNAVLQLSSKQAKVNIHTELPKIQIDNYEAFASAGLRNNGDMISLAAQKGYQQLMTFIEKTASDGKMLASVETGVNAIAEIAKRDSLSEPSGFDFTPDPGPRITVKGDVQMDADANSAGINNGVEGQFIPNEININYTPSEVSVKILQYGSISFNYQPNKIDQYI